MPVNLKHHIGTQMTILRFPEWQMLYQDALLESDRAESAQKVLTAECAINLRLQQLRHSTNSRAEKQAIDIALSTLALLKRDSLTVSEWESN